MRRAWMMGVILVLASANAWAATPEVPKAPPESWKSWQDVNAVSLSTDGADQRQFSWQGELWPNSDVRWVVANGDSERGTLLIVGGQAIAIQGLKTKPGSELDVLDQAVLRLRLVMAMLERARPEGPPALDRTRAISLKEDKTPLEVATMSAELSVPAPWSANGLMVRNAADAVVFEVQIKGGAVGGAPFAMHLKGTLSHVDSVQPLADATSLEGWSVYFIGPRMDKRGGALKLDYGATPATGSFKNLGEVRAALKKGDDVGKPDPDTDLRGVWMKRCSDGYGVKITRADPNSTYLISFCGPGGCVEPEHSRRSYISGDARFQIVSPDELKQRDGDTWVTLHRCDKKQ